MLEPVEKPEVTKKGVLKKLGGGGGGHKNWRDRFFVLSDHLYYYSDESAFTKGKDPLGVVALNAFSCGVDTNTESKFGFQLLSYPKSLVCRASSIEERDEWMRALLKPLEEVGIEAVKTGDEKK